MIPSYSTNQEYRPYDLVTKLTDRGLSRELGRCTTAPVALEQSLDDYVESFHTRNGFSRQRMDSRLATEFDRAVRDLASDYSANGVLRGETLASVVWGAPLSSR